MVRFDLLRFCLLIVPLTAFISCSGIISARKGDILFYSDNFTAASKEYSSGANKKITINKTLYLLNLAMSKFWEKNYTDALKSLNDAEKTNFEKNFFVSTMAAADRLPYQMKDFELAYLHFFKAVCYYKLNDIEKSLIELRQSLIKEPQSIFSEFLLGCISLNNLKDYNTSMVSMRKIISFNNYFLPAYGILSSILNKLGYNQESKLISESASSKNNDYLFWADNENLESLVIFIDLPKSIKDINYSKYILETYNTLKTQYKITKAADSNNNEQILDVLFKEVSPSYSPVPEPRSELELKTILSFNNYAVKSYNLNIPEPRFKDVLRESVISLFKDELKDEIRRKATKDIKPLGWLIRGKDTLDPRYWNTLPGKLDVVFLKIKPGTYNFKLSIFNENNLFLKDYDLNDITVLSSRLNLFFFRLGYDLNLIKYN
ncbi:hypothetical protein KA977_06165 [Candidatus Dependentiae bacterium]|nr:hypothetical protein [Candidatus Dependentiae bacterium]